MQYCATKQMGDISGYSDCIVGFSDLFHACVYWYPDSKFRNTLEVGLDSLNVGLGLQCLSPRYHSDRN